MPSGEYNCFFNSDLFIESGSTKKSIQVLEGTTTELDPIRMVRGGIVQGTIVLKDIAPSDTSLWAGRGEIVLFSDENRNSSQVYPVYRTEYNFLPLLMVLQRCSSSHLYVLQEPTK